MAAMSQFLGTVDQPRPKLVPPSNSTQAVVVDEAPERIRVRIRPAEGRPKHVLLGTINHCDFRVIKAIPLHLDVRGDTVIASWRQIDEFGTGPSMSRACDDLGHTVAELYRNLQAEESRLGPDLARVWGVLNEHVIPRS